MAFAIVHAMVAETLGPKIRFYDSLTAIAFFFAAPSFGLFAASLLLFVPFIGAVLGSFITALTFAVGLSALYKSTKELARLDMITTYVVISVLIASFFVMVYAAFLFNAASGL